MTCENCPKDFYYDCNQQPCTKAIAWEQLKASDRMEKDSYKSTGVHLNWVKLDGTRPTPFKENMK